MGGYRPHRRGDPMTDQRARSGTEDTYWLAGQHAVAAALRTGRVLSLGLMRGSRGLEDLAETAARGGVRVERLDRQEVQRRGGPQAQGCVALVRRRPGQSVAALVERTAAHPTSLLVALDHIQDPQNLGAIARSAECAGADGLLLPSHRACPVTAAAERVAAGAFDYLPWAVAPNLAQALDVCRRAGYWIFGLSMDGESVLGSSSLTAKTVLVVGAEGAGIGSLVRRHCDQIVRLPLFGRIESLNASVAVGIALYNWCQRFGQTNTLTSQSVYD